MSAEIPIDSDPTYAEAALVVWDMQEGIAGRAFNRAKLVENVARLAKAARMARIPVIYSQHTGLPFEYMSDPWRLMMHKRGMDPRKQIFLAEGSQEWGIMDELRPQARDIVLRKHAASFFVGTPLEAMLRARKTRILILAGVSTEGGVEGTARYAACSGFIPVIAEDAVGSFEEPVHTAMLAIMRRMFEVHPTDVIIANIASKAAIPLG